MLVWKFFVNYLFSKRSGALVRMLAWFSIFGITLGVAALITVISVMSGMHETIKKRITAIQPHLVFQIKGVKNPEGLKKSLAYTEFQRIATKQHGVYEKHDMIVRTVDGIFRGIEARGWSQKSWQSMLVEMRRQKEASKSGFLNWLDLPLPAPGEVYMGYDLAQTLGIIEGDPIHLMTPEGILLPPGEVPDLETVTVSRIIMTSLQEVDENQIYFAQGKTFLSFDESASREFGVEVWLENPFELEKTASVLRLAGAKVTTWAEQNSSLFFALSVEKLAITMFLGLSAIISSFSIIIVLTLLLSQKRGDIAILMTMGLSVGRIQRLFLGLGMILSGLGLLLGLVLGVSVSLYLQEFPLEILPKTVYYDSHLPSKVDWIFISAIFVLASLVSLISSAVPIRFLANFRPVVILQR